MFDDAVRKTQAAASAAWAWLRRKTSELVSWLSFAVYAAPGKVWRAARDTAAWLGPTYHSVRGKINAVELARTLQLAAGSTTVATFLQILLTQSDTWVTDPATKVAVGGWITFIVTVLDLYRRLHQGPQVPTDTPFKRYASGDPCDRVVRFDGPHAHEFPGQDEDDLPDFKVTYSATQTAPRYLAAAHASLAKVDAATVARIGVIDPNASLLIADLIASVFTGCSAAIVQFKLQRTKAYPNGLLAARMRHSIADKLPVAWGVDRLAVANGILLAGQEAADDPDQWVSAS